MNRDIYTMNIKKLQLNYIIQLIVNVIIIIFNFVLFVELFWLNNLLYYLYLFISIFGIFYILIPIILLLFILFKKLTQKSIKICKIISIIFCTLVIMTGLCFSIILMINALESNDYCRECPFNLHNSDINGIYDNFVNKNINENKLKEHCINRRCMYNNINNDSQYPYEYICNYDPTNEFDEIRNGSYSNDTMNQIVCTQIEKDNNKYNFQNNEISKFIDMCTSYDTFYFCQRISEPMAYSIEEVECPKSYYFIILLIYCMLSVILNLIVTFLPWRIAYVQYKNLIRIIRQINNRNGSASLHSTKNNSIIQQENMEESFKKEPTEIIIVYNETEENMKTEQNISFDINNNIEEDKNDKILINKISPIKKVSSNKNISNNYFKTNNKEKINNNNNKESKKEEINLKIYKKNDTPTKKKDTKKNKEIKKSNFRSNSHKISYGSERRFLEES